MIINLAQVTELKTKVRLKNLRGPEALQSRLRALGLKEGQEIQFWMSLPLGSPLVFKVINQLVGLRKEEAELIEVETAYES